MVYRPYQWHMVYPRRWVPFDRISNLRFACFMKNIILKNIFLIFNVKETLENKLLKSFMHYIIKVYVLFKIF
jgi:hypothetical protein